MDEKKKVAELTIGELKTILFGENHETKQRAEKRYLYGMADLANYLHVSIPTAWRMKKGILKPAIFQDGRTIITDVEKLDEILNGK